MTKTAEPILGAKISGGETQDPIDQEMKEVMKQFLEVFTGSGRATGIPDIHIEMDEMIAPVQQKQKQIPIH